MSLLNYIKQIWDTTSYVNPTRMNHIEDGIYAVSDKVDNLSAEDIAYDSNNSVKDMIDGIVVATSTGSKTLAQHLAVLKATFDTLSVSQKRRSCIVLSNQIFRCQNMNAGIYTYSIIISQSQKSYTETLNLSASKYEVLNGTTYTDASSNTYNSAVELVLL